MKTCTSCGQGNAEEHQFCEHCGTAFPAAPTATGHEEETVRWCREMLEMSPLALRMLKASFNADIDGLTGVQQLAGDATLLYYMSEEAQEGRDAYLEKRRPDFGKFPRLP